MVNWGLCAERKESLGNASLRGGLWYGEGKSKGSGYRRRISNDIVTSEGLLCHFISQVEYLLHLPF